MIKLISVTFFLSLFLTISNCGGYSKVNTRETPVNSQERARKNVQEGRGASLGGLMKGRSGSTNYEFSSSNPMWRASLEILDFLPLTTVDYSGGMIISDWYTDSSNKQNDSIKITIRFLTNEVRSDSLKIIVHKKTCATSLNCKTILLSNSKIIEELRSSIVRKAALIEKESKKKN